MLKYLKELKKKLNKSSKLLNDILKNQLLPLREDFAAMISKHSVKKDHGEFEGEELSQPLKKIDKISHEMLKSAYKVSKVVFEFNDDLHNAIT